MQISGHRGQVVVGGPIENTVDAVEAALSAGADGVEVDVRLSADGVAVCVHDPTMMRITGLPIPVRELTFAQLRGFQLANGGRIAHVGEVATAVQGCGTLVVEVKHDPWSVAQAGTAVIGALAGNGIGGDVVVSSFSNAVLTEVRRHDGRARRALVTGRYVPVIVALADARADGHHELHAHLSPMLCDHGVVDRARAAGIAVRCWTVNRGLDARLLDIAGVCGVITDNPKALRTSITAAMETPTIERIG